MHRQIGILVSAMILGTQLGIPARAEQPSTEQLREIATLLSGDDYPGLRAYLRARPELLVEDSALSNLLREFMAGSNSAAASGLNDDLSEALGRFSSQNSDSSDSDPGQGGASQY